MKNFNVTGLCVPEEDYMVDISKKISEITKLIDDKAYFTINRARQYGKTTTLSQLRRQLKDEYIMVSLSFQKIGDKSFASEEAFCQMFLNQISRALRFTAVSKEYRERWFNQEVTTFEGLDEHITDLCEGKRIVLLIDEVDKISNNRVFLNFLSLLREKFLARKDGLDYTFHSVILAGVYDIKNIKFKMINEGTYVPKESENQLQNSPWNIAVNFKVDMSFSPAEISSMLNEYEKDYVTGMNIGEIANEIYFYTAGYPLLVSLICQCIDQNLNKKWTSEGVKNAVAIILKEEHTLFKDLAKNLEGNSDLYKLLYDVLILGRRRSFTLQVPTIELAVRYGLIKSVKDSVRISNKIFEKVMTNYFIGKDEERVQFRSSGVLYHDVVTENRFNMEHCLEKFADFYSREIFPSKEKEFLEEHYRLMFLSYLKPLLNGVGHMHLESALIDERRMDLVVDFGKQQFVLELKRIYSETNRLKAFEQLLGYMESRGTDVGYLLTFDFRKKSNPKAEWIEIDGKKVFEVVV